MKKLIETANLYLSSNFFRIFLAEKIDLTWVFLASSVANLLMLTPMLYMLQIFDRIFISKSVLTLLTISGIIIFFYLISSLSGYIRSRIIIALGIKLEKKVNEKLFNVSFEERLRKQVKNPVSYLDDLTIVRQWLTGAAVFAIFDLPWVPVYVLIMFIMHPLLGYVSLVLIIILIVFGFYFSRVLGNQDELLREEEYETNDFLYSKLRNAEALAVYSLPTNFKQTWLENKKNFYISLNKSQKKTDTIQNTMKQYRFFANSLALTVGAYLVISGELTLGSMIAASLLMSRTTQPVDGAVSALSRVTIVREAFWRVEKMLNLASLKTDILVKENELDDKSSKTSSIKSIVLRDVNVSYSENGPKVLSNVNLLFESGNVITVVGKSGAGKTTLIKLLSGLVRYEGEVSFDNSELKELSSDDSYNLIGYLPQDVLMLPGSIAENISSFRNPNSDRIIEVAKLAGIHDFILKFPEGYDTGIVGGYQNLSGGERQRIGLARAIYNNPACLFLDEPNSALDNSGEVALRNVINYCKNKGKLIVVVSHRRSVLDYSDKILEFLEDKDIRLSGRDEFLRSFSSKQDFDNKFNY